MHPKHLLNITARQFIAGLAAVSLNILAGCGGGAQDSGVSVSPEHTDASVKVLSASADSASTISATSSSTYCKTYVANNPLKCIQTTTDPAYSSYWDGASLGMGPEIPACPIITPGTPYMGITPSPSTALSDGYNACFQFVLTSQTTVPIEVKFPSGTTGLVELYIEGTNTGSYKQTSVESPKSPLSFTYTNQNARMLLVIRTYTGNKGRQMGIGVGVDAPVPASNDTYQNALVANMSQTFTGTIKTPGVSEAYYFYPQVTGQTTQEIAVNFTTNQTATYRQARMTAPGTYSLGTEIALTAAQSGTVNRYTSTNPANAAGTATPYGIMLKVKGAYASAPADEPFAVRVSTLANTIGGFGLTNIENISRYYPDAKTRVQAATYITANLGVADANGTPVQGEAVMITYQQNTGDANSVVTVPYTTDTAGKISATFPLSACSGTLLSASNYGPYGSPTDHWDGTSQQASVSALLPNSSNSSLVQALFLRICSETYRGRY